MRKAQALVISSTVLILLIIAVIGLFYTQFGTLQGSDNRHDELKKQSSQIGAVLASQGFPANWDPESVQKLGLETNGYITNETLIKFLYTDYTNSKLLLGIRADYLFFFTIENVNDPINLTTPETDEHPVPYKIQYFGWNGQENDDEIKEKINGGSSLEQVLRLLDAQSKVLSVSEQFVSLRMGDNPAQTAKMVVYVWDFADGYPNLEEFKSLGPPFFEFDAFLNTRKLAYSSGQSVELTGTP